MREDRAAAFLAATGCGSWQRIPLAGDASPRRYTRLVGPGGARAILMDADPDHAGPQTAFLAVAAHLRAHGLAAPAIRAADEDAGFLLLEDLGERDVARHMRETPGDEPLLADAVADLLARLARIPPLEGLPRLDPATGGAMLEPLTWYAPDLTAATLDRIARETEAALAGHASPPQTLALRDFHAENLIWRPGREGTDRLGLLDFQDAFLAPPSYDLVSYIHDARRDVPPATADHIMDRFARLTGTDPAQLAAEAAVLSAQRNLRILGVFARLARRDGKLRYLDLLPRVWGHVMTATGHPCLAPLRAALGDLPDPATAHLARIAS